MVYSLDKMFLGVSKLASAYTSLMGFLMLANSFTPEPVKYFLSQTFGPFFKRFLERIFFLYSTQMTMVVYDQKPLNDIYSSAQIYLPTKINPSIRQVRVSKSNERKTISLGLEEREELIDFYKNVKLTWRLYIPTEINTKGHRVERMKYFKLTFEKHHNDIVVNEYLPFVIEKAKEISDNVRELKLCRWSGDVEGDDGEWGKFIFNHPVTFDKLAMDPDLKKAVVEDVDRFVRRKDYYKKVGKAWKRGYLLYGPPGTGKSSLVAAMANRLRFDVYDLELASLQSDAQLRNVLLGIDNKSIIVIEDIDCSSQVQNRNTEPKPEQYRKSKKKVQASFTLSGLLNFIDGLWSTCGNERIIIFTTNHRDKLDPALLRAGRMDMHIYMGYCTPEGFEVLAFNYLGTRDHPKLIEIKGLIKEVNITPAELAEHLMRDENVDLALEGVLYLLKKKGKKPALSVTAKDVLSVKCEENGIAEENP